MSPLAKDSFGIQNKYIIYLRFIIKV